MCALTSSASRAELSVAEGVTAEGLETEESTSGTVSDVAGVVGGGITDTRGEEVGIVALPGGEGMPICTGTDVYVTE